MDDRRYYLKELAARQARLWGTAPLPPCFAGEMRIETRNTVYDLVDGVCRSALRREKAPVSHSNPDSFVGMRVVGWLSREDPQGGLTLDWRPGSYAVLWRPRAAGEEHSAVALTSSTIAFRKTLRTPLPAPMSRPTPLPPLPSPPVVVKRPAPPSMTRLHNPGDGASSSQVYASQTPPGAVDAPARPARPPIAPTPPRPQAARPSAHQIPAPPHSTPVRASSVPPPLPPRSKATLSGARLAPARAHTG